MNASLTSTPLATGWTFKQGNLWSTHDYLPANDVPTEVHRDLLENHEIKNPFKDLNELSVRWVGDETWTYRNIFTAPPNHGKANTNTVLKFEGLDTFAMVYLNKQLILKSENMFVEHRVDVTVKLKSGENVLEIVFDSARKRGLELVAHHKEHRFIVHQTEISRGPVRKAQYHWGWDWGPILLTSGPWKPITIETYTCRVLDVWVRYKLTADLSSAEVMVSAEYEGPLATVSLAIVSHKTNETVASRKVDLIAKRASGIVKASFTLNEIELWWPRGYGPQSLYTVHATAHIKKEVPHSTLMHSSSKRFGFREAELIQEPDGYGTSFYLRINKVDIFSGGSCWIPADSCLTRLTAEKYRNWVSLAADGNQIMLRVWGGGIYEANDFYDAADELGVLIWQDFAFACANYPAYPEYLKSVEQEARQNARRLRNHPSLVIWAGNNEDYQIVERYNLEYDHANTDPESWLKTNFPARYIYEHLLPKIVREECQIPYHPSSPFGSGVSTVLKVDPTIGDVHQWNVWHGTMQPYQQLPDMGGRFVSEFGMEAYPHVSSLEKCITREEDRYPGSMAMEFRNKAIGHERRLISYVAENFRIRYDLEGFTHLTQVMQADAMSWAYKSWRRQWGSRGSRKCGGVLVWQLNDCWPTISWAVVDYYGVPKPAYYAIKRAMEPVTIGVQRKHKSWTLRPADELWQRDTGHIDIPQLWEDTRFEVWVANCTREAFKAEITVQFISIKSGRETRATIKRDGFIVSNGITDIFPSLADDGDVFDTSERPFETSGADPFVIHTSLYVNNRCIATDVSWPDPIKYLSFEDRALEVRYSDDKTRVLVSAAKPVKGFVFSEREGLKLSDNGFDVVPGETKEVRVTGYAADELKWRYVEM